MKKPPPPPTTKTESRYDTISESMVKWNEWRTQNHDQRNWNWLMLCVCMHTWLSGISRMAFSACFSSNSRLTWASPLRLACWPACFALSSLWREQWRENMREKENRREREKGAIVRLWVSFEWDRYVMIAHTGDWETITTSGANVNRKW